MTRSATKQRTTNETDIRITLEVDGTGTTDVATGIPFFDHMLSQIGRHGGFDLTVIADGDLAIDAHHTVEDTGILLGEVLKAALGDKAGVRRFASASVPLDEALVDVALDLSGRPFLAFEADLPPGDIAGFEHELAEEFFRAVSNAGRLTLHVTVETGTNAHHMIEAAYKAFARALRQAVAIDPDETGVPSTKGTLTA
jgi:imidazoleglycerol-phosphate dehydratase